MSDLLMMLRLMTLSLLCFLFNLFSHSAVAQPSFGSVRVKETSSSPLPVNAEISIINDTMLTPLSSPSHKDENNDTTRPPFAATDRVPSKPAASPIKSKINELTAKPEKIELSKNNSAAKSSSGGKCNPNPCKHGQCSVVNRNESTMDVFKQKGYRCVCEKGFEGFTCDRKIGSRISATFISSVTFFSVLAFYVIILLIGFVLKAKKARATKGKYSPSDAEKDDKKISAFVLHPPTFERLI